MRVTLAFFPSGASPLPTVPDSFKSMYHDSALPAFLSWKAKIAPPFFIASLRSASFAERDAAMASKAADEGKASTDEK